MRLLGPTLRSLKEREGAGTAGRMRGSTPSFQGCATSCWAASRLLPRSPSWGPLLFRTLASQMSRALTEAWPPQRLC